MNRAVVFLISFAAAACIFGACVVGESGPPIKGDRPGGGGVPNPIVTLSGQTVDYFIGDSIGAITMETIGLAPEQMVTSTDRGRFELDVPIASSFFVRTQATSTHRPTLSEVVGLSEATSANIFVVSEADISRQHVTAGIAVIPNTTIVIVDVSMFDNTPLKAFSRSNLTIVNPNTEAVVATEPFVIGALGDVDPSLTESAPGLTARFAFLNVATGQHALVLTCPNCEPYFETSQTLISSAGVTLTHVTLGASQGPSPKSFEAIAPLFDRGANGGLGCANCHNTGGVSPVLDGDPIAIRKALLATPGLIDTDDPDNSLLLSKPLYESPANHPNATFLSSADPHYQAIRAWITNGTN